jgi:molecular chaperone GrpE
MAGEGNRPEEAKKSEGEPKKEETRAEPAKKEEAKEKPETEEYSKLKDSMLRLAAEFDNYKKRVARDIDSAKDLGKAELVKALLPALDEFELALMAFNGSTNEKNHAKGVELVFSNILGTLKSAGLKEIDSKGKYDPYRHEIIMAKESSEPEGAIIEVVRKGYKFNDILLRPSAVIVSKGRAKKEEETNEKMLLNG